MATLLRVLMRRFVAVTASALGLFAGGVALSSCGSDDGEASETVTITDTTTTIDPPTQTTVTTPPPTGPTVVRIVVVNGAPKGGIVRETVEMGDRVVLVVTSDAADHIHLHGYDITREVAPGKPARLPFKATIPGRFEVELEDLGVPIADITVTT